MVISFIVIVLINLKYYPINKIIFFYKMKNKKKEEDKNATFTIFFTTNLKWQIVISCY